MTTRQVQGAVTHILPGPDRNGIASVYVISETNRAYSLGIDGTLLGEIQSPAKIMSAAYWPEARLLLLGGADDRVYAFDDAGKLRWTFQSEMHPDVYATGKTYWFKKDLPGIYGLHTGCLTGQGTQAFVGSACTVEVVDPSGKLLKRVPVYWGSCAVMQIVPNPDKTRKLVVAKAPNLSNDYSTIHGGNWSTGHFGVSPPFQLSQSTLNILVDDLNHDGQLEVICDTNGSMNDVRVYDCLGKSLWSAEFGPPSAGAARAGITVPPPIMRGLVVLDFQGHGAEARRGRNRRRPRHGLPGGWQASLGVLPAFGPMEPVPPAARRRRPAGSRVRQRPAAVDRRSRQARRQGPTRRRRPEAVRRQERRETRPRRRDRHGRRRPLSFTPGRCADLRHARRRQNTWRNRSKGRRSCVPRVVRLVESGPDELRSWGVTSRFRDRREALEVTRCPRHFRAWTRFWNILTSFRTCTAGCTCTSVKHCNVRCRRRISR